MDKIAFSKYVPRFHAEVNTDACADEVQREIETRKRLYDRWVAEGKITWQEGHDRMTRLMGALLALREGLKDQYSPTLERPAQPF